MNITDIDSIYMKTYTLDFKGHLFKVTIGEVDPRWENEGILQTIKITVNKCIVYRELFGLERALNNFKTETYEFIENGAYCMFLDYKTKTISFTQLLDMDITLTNEDFDLIINWIITSLTPITEQRKEKIDRIKNKMTYSSI